MKHVKRKNPYNEKLRKFSQRKMLIRKHALMATYNVDRTIADKYQMYIDPIMKF